MTLSPSDQAVRDNMKTVCKCQGLSGSCTVKTCYQRIPVMATIGGNLVTKYKYATRVLDTRRDDTWVLYDPHGVQPRQNELIYIDSTNPDLFCEPNEAVGSQGTRGRICSVTSLESDACNNLCCDRPYDKADRKVNYDCKCTFVYDHLEMKCSTCNATITETRCT